MNQVAKTVAKMLIKAGYQAYFVGGCVRDQLLNLPYDDIDIATSALPDVVMALFDKTIATGIEYGTVTVCQAGHSFEVTTFRRDYDYTDGRRPSVVAFSDDITTDLSRRDFTINAMAMTLDGEIIDPFGGQADLNAKLIRTVGLADVRFAEDKLRKLRAVRFAAQKNFRLDKQLRNALKRDANLQGVSIERIFSELNKILLSDNASYGLRLLADCGLLAEVSPKLADMVGFDQKNPHHKYDLFEHTLRVVDYVPQTLPLRWAALLHDVGKLDTMTIGDDGVGHFYDHQSYSVIIAEQLLNKLKAPTKLRQTVLNLVGKHMYKPVLEAKPLRRWINKIGLDNVDDMVALMRADMLATGTLDESFTDQLKLDIAKILAEKPPFSRADLVLNGHQLMAQFDVLKDNPKLLKPLFGYLVEHCLAVPADNNKTQLLHLAENWLNC